jgi:hypothetical protein
MASARSREFKMMHSAVQRTDDVLVSLQPGELRNFKYQESLKDMYYTLENRFYRQNVTTKSNISDSFLQKIQSYMMSNHEKVRKNPKEKKKLDDMEEALRKSPELRAVIPDTNFFER